MKITPEEIAMAQRALARLNVRYAERREFQEKFPQNKDKPAPDDNPHTPQGFRSPFFECQRQYEGFSQD